MKTYIKANSTEYDCYGNELTYQQSAFFQNSKIRDGRGRLLVCYHSTSADFDTFDKQRIGSGFGGSFGAGIYFATDKSYASVYGNKVLECYLNIVNPFDYMQYGTNKLVIDLMQKEGYKFNPEDVQNCSEMYSEDAYDIVEILYDNGYSSLDFSKCLMNAGYDGINIDSEIVAFEPNQIKAISNKNPTSSDNIHT